MDSVDSIRSLVEIASQAIAVWTFLAVALAGVLVWKRTGSGHMLLVRMWSIFVGNNECQHAGIDKFLGDLVAIMKFRFRTGMKVRTLTQVLSVIAYTEANNEDIGDLARCGPYFDIEKCALKPEDKRPRFVQQGLLCIGIGVLAFGIILAVFGLFPDRALMRVTDSGVWFVMDMKQANRFSLNPFSPVYARVDMEQCGKLPDSLGPGTGFDRGDIATICNLIKEPESAFNIGSAIKSQRAVFAVAIVYFGIPLLMMLGTVRHGYAAWSVAKRLRERHDNLTRVTPVQVPPAAPVPPPAVA